VNATIVINSCRDCAHFGPYNFCNFSGGPNKKVRSRGVPKWCPIRVDCERPKEQRMRKYKTICDAGPYRVNSCADGTLRVYPEWPTLPKWNEQDGGGPGLGDRIELSAVMEKMLNEKAREG